MSNQREVMSKNLSNLIGRKGIDQKILADYLEISEMSVSNWVNGVKYPRMTNIQKMADYFGVMKSDLIEEKDSKPTFTSSQYLYYPADISAGLLDDIEAITKAEVINIPDSIMGKYAGKTNFHLSRVNGESMNKTIPHNSLIAVKPIEMNELKDGDIVVYSNDHEYAVKLFYRYENEIWFRPHSTDFRFKDNVYDLNNDDVSNLQIHGKVIMYIVELD